MKLLFICGGNTCRSPMAAAIAHRVFGASVETANGGIAPHGDSATPDAIAVTRDLFGIDLASHRPRQVDGSVIANCDYIVALDSYVARHLREKYGVSAQLIEWQIDGPFLNGRKAYERCAKEIESAARSLKAELAKRLLSLHKAEIAKPDRAEASFSDAITSLRQDLERWKNEVAEGTVRGTTLQGIAKKAVDSFEVILRRTVNIYRVLAADSERKREQGFSGKPFERLTLGELIHYLEKNNKQFTSLARLDSTGSRMFKSRTVVTPISRLLNSISAQRNVLHHQPQKFAPDTETLLKNTSNLLSLLSQVLRDRLFEYAAARPES